MANKRMFNIKIVDSDSFLDMPLTAQCLYFHLNMRADDDGFVGNPKRVQRLIGASDDDMRLLIAKRFVLTFDDGVIVIKHWRMHNTLSANRYKETTYIDQKRELLLKENNAYSFNSGVPLDDSKMIEKASRLSQKQIDATLTRQRRTIDATLTDTGLDLDIDKDIDIELVKELESDKKKDKRETYVSILDSYTSNDFLKSSLNDFVEMRKKMKGFTTRAFKLALNKLDELSNDDNEKIKIVNQSVMNSWKSFYELKEESNKYPSWYKEGTKEKTKEDRINSLEAAYKATVNTYKKGIISYEEFKKREASFKKSYFDLTGKDITKHNLIDWGEYDI